MTRTRVRTHFVRRKDGKVYARRAHTRRDPTRRGPDAWNISPKRALRNARRSRRHIRGGRRTRAVLWGTGAACEIAAYTLFKPVGTLLVIGGGVLFMTALQMRGNA